MRRIYTHLGYDDYKKLGAAIKTMLERETTHMSESDDADNPSVFYHKSYSLPIGEDLVFEFHGPPVAGINEEEKAFAYGECPHPFNMVEVTGVTGPAYPYCRSCGRSNILLDPT